MPIDRTPQVVEYRIAPVQAEGRTDFASIAARFMGAQREQSTMSLRDRMLEVPVNPAPLDLASPSMTGADRQALAIASTAIYEGRLANTGVRMPESYVGEVIGARMASERIDQKIAAGTQVTAVEAKAYRCRVVSVVMDRRAEAYVVGGERAAAAIRANVPKERLEECVSSAGRPAKGSLFSQAEAASRSRADPSAHRAGSLQASVMPARRDVAPSSVDLQAKRTVRVDPAVSPKTRVNPVAFTPSKGPSTGVDLVATVHARSRSGNGI